MVYNDYCFRDAEDNSLRHDHRVQVFGNPGGFFVNGGYISGGGPDYEYCQFYVISPAGFQSQECIFGPLPGHEL